jgi:hypothetical protein
MRQMRHLLVVLLAVSAACASNTSRTRTNADQKVITAAELNATTEANLLDYVRNHRPRWLSPRTAASLPQRGAPITTGGGGVVVYVDDSRMGSSEVLRTLSRSGVTMLRFYDVTEAQQKFPNRETTAVIQVITR